MVEVSLEGISWVLVGISMAFCGALFIKNQILKYQIKTLDVDDVVKRLKLKEQYIQDLEKEIDGYRSELQTAQEEAKSWSGKYYQKGQIKKLPGDKYDLTNKSDIGIVAEDILNQVEDSLPPDIQKVIKDPQIRKKILDYANENPDEAIEYIKHFIGKKSSTSQSSLIPDFKPAPGS